ncbi:AsnC family transcriptional regulator [Priestia aryabhattai]|nr:AsnC family transcriptional regulator [Priestia aryabhattai]MBY0104000.1 AsnC family transcriptional regulator [Priestia aryabhattai]
MDLIDCSLLQFIQEDSRITVNELSKRLLLSQLSIRKRVLVQKVQHTCK